MKAAELKLLDKYFSMLKNLSREGKLEIINRLTNSLNPAKKEKDTSWKSLSGALILNKPVEEFLSELREDRHFNRNTEDL